MRFVGALLRNPLLAGFFMAVALLGCGGGGSGSEPVTVEIYGDSITFGPAIGRNVAAQVKALRPGWLVDDRSAAGLNLRDLVTGYAEPFPGAPKSDYPKGAQPAFDKVQRSARFVVIELGGNDALSERPPEQFEADLRSVIDVLVREGRAPVMTGIVGVPPSDYFTPAAMARRDVLNAITHKVAQAYGLPHAGWGEDYRGDADTHDLIHRTQAASDRLAALLVAAIEKGEK